MIGRVDRESAEGKRDRRSKSSWWSARNENGLVMAAHMQAVGQVSDADDASTKPGAISTRA